jgi:hypothetical protein
MMMGLYLSESTFAAGVSDETNGLYIVVSAWRHTGSSFSPVFSEPIRFDDELVWMPSSSIGEVNVNYKGPVYCVQIKMYDTNNDEVAKTLLGNVYGSKFDQFRPGDYAGTILATGNNHFDKRILDRGLGGRPLPAPGDLFKIKKPGIYTLEVKIQLLQVDKKDPNDTKTWSQELVQFSPIKLKVEKPEE